MCKIFVHRNANLADVSDPSALWTFQTFPDPDESRAQTHSAHARGKLDGCDVAVNIHFHRGDVILLESILVVPKSARTADSNTEADALAYLEGELKASNNYFRRFDSFPETLREYLLKLPRMLSIARKCRVNDDFWLELVADEDLSADLKVAEGSRARLVGINVGSEDEEIADEERTAIAREVERQIYSDVCTLVK